MVSPKQQKKKRQNIQTNEDRKSVQYDIGGRIQGKTKLQSYQCKYRRKVLAGSMWTS